MVDAIPDKPPSPAELRFAEFLSDVRACVEQANNAVVGEHQYGIGMRIPWTMNLDRAISQPLTAIQGESFGLTVTSTDASSSARFDVLRATVESIVWPERTDRMGDPQYWAHAFLTHETAGVRLVNGDFSQFELVGVDDPTRFSETSRWRVQIEIGTRDPAAISTAVVPPRMAHFLVDMARQFAECWAGHGVDEFGITTSDVAVAQILIELPNTDLTMITRSFGMPSSDRSLVALHPAEELTLDPWAVEAEAILADLIRAMHSDDRFEIASTVDRLRTHRGGDDGGPDWTCHAILKVRSSA